MAVDASSFSLQSPASTWRDVFLNLTIGINTPCKHRCVMESECVSVNIGPPLNGRVVCELSNSDHVKYPEDTKQRPGWIYRATEVQIVDKN